MAASGNTTTKKTVPVPITAALERKLRAWDDEGLPRREMERRTGISFHRITKLLGRKYPKPKDGNPRPTQVIYCYDGPFADAEKIAKSHGLLKHAGYFAGEGNVGAMVEAIGEGRLVVMSAAERDNLLIAAELMQEKRQA